MKLNIEDPNDYEARSNIMWTATWALNTLISRGKSTDWMVHMLGQAAGGYTDATHGMTLSAVSLPYYRYIMPYGLQKFNPREKNFLISVMSMTAIPMFVEWAKTISLLKEKQKKHKNKGRE